MYRIQLLSLFLIVSSISQAAITLNLQVTPESAEDANQAMNCEMTLSRGRQNPEATLEGIKSNMVATKTQVRGYRMNEAQVMVYVDKQKTGLISLDYDHFEKQIDAVAKTKLKGYRGGPVGPRITYSGEIDGKKFTLREISENGEVYNPSEDAELLRSILLKNCYQ